MARRILTEDDLYSVTDVLSRIKELGKEAAQTAKSLPLDPSFEEGPIINQKNEELLMRFLIFFMQNAELAECLMGILEVDRDEEETKEGRQRAFIAYREYLRAGFASQAYQMKKLCSLLEIDFNGLIHLGEAMNTEKGEEFSLEHPGRRWY